MFLSAKGLYNYLKAKKC